MNVGAGGGASSPFDCIGLAVHVFPEPPGSTLINNQGSVGLRSAGTQI